jgi:(1->4)-alpha-D-glucan 1-alpha-D-glucosylmutase
MGADRLVGAGTHAPVSTYRLQLGPDLSFDEVRARLDYYVALGVTDLYLSPLLQAAPGSTHGYDVVDHYRLSEVMGGRGAFERLADAAHARGLGIIVDVVPNHMAIPTPEYHNRAFWSVLAEGPDSPFASWFDIDWAAGNGRVLMPILGVTVEEVLGAGQLSLDRIAVPGHGDRPQTVLRYYDHVLPVRPGTEALSLAELMDRQHYRLAHWLSADTELNYRRFFDVRALVAIRIEADDVFDATHALLFELARAGHIDGFRIDHPDGLADPRQYFARLARATDGAWVVAEKILEADEQIPPDWQVAGTTGYDALWRVQSLFLDPAGDQPLGALMERLTGDVRGDLPGVVRQAKREIVATLLQAEVERLTSLLADICQVDVQLGEHTREALKECVVALLVELDRYRAYVVPGEVPSRTSEDVMAAAAQRARAVLDHRRHATLQVVVDLLLGRQASSGGWEDPKRADVVLRFQQVTGAVMAKGVEDTAFYRWTHLASLCEVGGAPQRFAITPDELHGWAQHVSTSMPTTMTAGSTHDTKRGEDVRARMGVLSQYPEEWADLIGVLRQLTANRRPPGLDGRTENLLWQTLAGTWTVDGPIGAHRLAGYLIKASREAKTWTSWQAPDPAAEEELTGFVTHLVTDADVARAFDGWVARTAPALRAAVLGTKLVQLTLPGVADVYQGTESHVITLVDPDNRGPVDAGTLAERVGQLDAGADVLDLADEKLALTAAALRLRRDVPGAFVGALAGYRPLPTSTAHAVAFARTEGRRPRVITLVSRLSASLARSGGWDEHTVVLPDGLWRNVLDGPAAAPIAGGQRDLAPMLRTRPVALLARIDR